MRTGRYAPSACPCPRWPSCSSSSPPEQVRDRALDALAEEIGLMLAEGVVAAPMDIDLCLILGAGWPFHLGGITPYLDRTGVSERVLGRRFLPPGVGSLPDGNLQENPLRQPRG